MNHFSSYHFTDHDGQHIFGWTSGKKSGYLSYPILDDPKSSLFAELLLINEFLFRREIFGVRILHGTGIRLHVSSGQVKKLFLKKVKCDLVEPLMRPLRLRLLGVDIETLRGSESYLPPPPTPVSEREEIHSGLVNTEDYMSFDTPNIGKVLITAHALDQYVDRLEDEVKPKRPLRSLLTRLENPKLAPIILPTSVKQHKDRKYGIETRECWGHLTSDMHFMFVRDKTGLANLVTSYKRAPEYR